MHLDSPKRSPINASSFQYLSILTRGALRELIHTLDSKDRYVENSEFRRVIFAQMDFGSTALGVRTPESYGTRNLIFIRTRSAERDRAGPIGSPIHASPMPGSYRRTNHAP